MFCYYLNITFHIKQHFKTGSSWKNFNLKFEKYLYSCLASQGMITILISFEIVTLMVLWGFEVSLVTANTNL